MYHRDEDYVVTDGEVKIVDEFTGRIMEGRRWSEGLHQAVEAKEGVLVREENQTLATITLQNYFRLYDKLSGMTGTALTEDAEFRQIYNLPVQAIPPNKPVIREDNDDLIYRTVEAKFDAVVEDVVARHANGQPVLVGTGRPSRARSACRACSTSAASSTRSSTPSTTSARPHIVAQAGRLGAVTIATNMAGRGTDILLGGNPEFLALDERCATAASTLTRPPRSTTRRAPLRRRGPRQGLRAPTSKQKVIAAGGLCVIGTERHESRRIDNQLRGRSGASGRPRVDAVLPVARRRPACACSAAIRDGRHRRAHAAHEHARRHAHPGQARRPRPVESAQRKVEDMNFAARKHVLEYDDVMNKQRQVIYGERNKILDGKDLADHVGAVMEDTVDAEVANFANPASSREEWDLEGLDGWVEQLTGRDDFDAGALADAGRRGGRRQDPRLRADGVPREDRGPGPAGHLAARAPGHAPRHRHTMDELPAGDGLPQDGHRPARLRPARPARRVQGGGVPRLRHPGQHDVRGLPAHRAAHRARRAPRRRPRRAPGGVPARRRDLLRGPPRSTATRGPGCCAARSRRARSAPTRATPWPRARRRARAASRRTSPPRTTPTPASGATTRAPAGAARSSRTATGGTPANGGIARRHSSTISPTASPRSSATCRSRLSAPAAPTCRSARPPRVSGTTPPPPRPSWARSRRLGEDIKAYDEAVAMLGEAQSADELAVEADDEETARLRLRVHGAARGHARRARALELVHRGSSTTATPS